MPREHTSISEGIVILERRLNNAKNDLVNCNAKLLEATTLNQSVSNLNSDGLINLATHCEISLERQYRKSYRQEEIYGFTAKQLYWYIVDNNLTERENVTVDSDYNGDVYLLFESERLESDNEFYNRIKNELREHFRVYLNNLTTAIADLGRTISKLNIRIGKTKGLVGHYLYQSYGECMRELILKRIEEIKDGHGRDLFGSKNREGKLRTIHGGNPFYDIELNWNQFTDQELLGKFEILVMRSYRQR